MAAALHRVCRPYNATARLIGIVPRTKDDQSQAMGASRNTPHATLWTAEAGPSARTHLDGRCWTVKHPLGYRTAAA